MQLGILQCPGHRDTVPPGNDMAQNINSGHVDKCYYNKYFPKGTKTYTTPLICVDLRFTTFMKM